MSDDNASNIIGVVAIIRQENETAQQYMHRLQHQAATNNNQHLETTSKHKPQTKTCSECGHKNTSAAKKCVGMVGEGKSQEHCQHPLPPSENPSAIASRAKRLKKKRQREEEVHNICLVCQKDLHVGQELSIGLCCDTRDRGYRIVPCGRTFHHKCLDKHIKVGRERHEEYGIRDVKCPHCQKILKEPFIIKIFGPHSSKLSSSNKVARTSSGPTSTSSSTSRPTSTSSSTSNSSSSSSTSNSSSSSSSNHIMHLNDAQIAHGIQQSLLQGSSSSTPSSISSSTPSSNSRSTHSSNSSSTSSSTSVQPQTPEAVQPISIEENMVTMVEMGFDSELSHNALRDTGNDLVEAINSLSPSEAVDQ